MRPTVTPHFPRTLSAAKLTNPLVFPMRIVSYSNSGGGVGEASPIWIPSLVKRMFVGPWAPK